MFGMYVGYLLPPSGVALRPVSRYIGK